MSFLELIYVYHQNKQVKQDKDNRVQRRQKWKRK